MSRFFSLFSLYFICPLSLFMIGCAVPSSLRFPANSFMYPETSGGFAQGKVALQYIGTADVHVVDDISSVTPNTNPSVRKNGALRAQLDFGLGNNIDFYGSGGQLFPNIYGLKIQLLGDSRKAAKEKSWSLALFGGYALGKYSIHESENSVNGDSVNDYKGYESGLSLGYRVQKSILFYSTTAYKRVAGNAIISRDDGSTSSVTANPEGNGNMMSLSLGVYVSPSENFFFALEAALAETHWKRTYPTPDSEDSEGDVYFGIQSGLQW